MCIKKTWKTKIMVVVGVIILLLLAIKHSFLESGMNGFVYAMLWLVCISGMMYNTKKKENWYED